MDNQEFTDKIPNFASFVNEDLSDAAKDNVSGAPYNEEKPDPWEVSSIEYDTESGDIIFSISGGGYPSEVRIWSGDDAIIEWIDPMNDMGEEEFDARLVQMVDDLRSKPTALPDQIRNLLDGELVQKYDPNWADEHAQQSVIEPQDGI